MKKIAKAWSNYVKLVNRPTTLPGRKCQCVDPNGYTCDRQCSTES